MRKAVCFLFTAVLLFGMIGVASATVLYDSGVISENQNVNWWNSNQYDFSVKTSFSGTVSSAELIVTTQGAYGYDNVFMNSSNYLGSLSSGNKPTANDFSISVITPGTIQFDVTDSNFWDWNGYTFVSYEVIVDGTPASHPFPSPAPCFSWVPVWSDSACLRKRFKKA